MTVPRLYILQSRLRARSLSLQFYAQIWSATNPTNHDRPKHLVMRRVQLSQVYTHEPVSPNAESLSRAATSYFLYQFNQSTLASEARESDVHRPQ